MSEALVEAVRISPDPTLVIRQASKSFGGQRALSDVTFSLNPGEVHALLGQNGSGKSTLIKMLAGYHQPDFPTELVIHGEAHALPLKDGKAGDVGLSFVHQDLGLIDQLSVAENVRAPVVTARGNWWIRMRAQRQYTEALFERYGIPVSATAQVRDLSRSDRALIAIARAMDTLDAAKAKGLKPGVIFLDETTAFLPLEGISALFSLVRRFTSEGGSAVFVSHDLDEALTHADRVTVMRDGRVAATTETTNLRREDLIQLIVGRQVDRHVKSERSRADRTAVKVSGLSGGVVNNVAFTVGTGEILGLTGLLGSGFDEIPDLIFGVRPADAGSLVTEASKFELTKMTPFQAVRQGMALIPSDRLNDGGVQTLTVGDNAGMQTSGTLGKSWALARRQNRETNRQVLRTFAVSPDDPTRIMSELSGGNQQKVVLSKWLRSAPSIVLMQEPTQGVDVGARAEIYRILTDARDRGAAIICASADHDQLAELCDRVLVFKGGRQIAELSGERLQKSVISAACLAS